MFLGDYFGQIGGGMENVNLKKQSDAIPPYPPPLLP